MKAIQITIDERLLSQLDEDEEVKKDGRSAVFRRAVAAYLKEKREREISRRYEEAYGDGEGLGDEFEGWEEQGQWPDP